MSKVIFKTLSVQNFKSIGDKISIDFSEYEGLNHVFGINKDIPGTSNGSGKSTIFLDAMLFALFAKTLKNTAREYIPNRGYSSKKGHLPTETILTYEIDDAQYKNITSIDKIGGTVSYILIKDGKDITKSSINQTRDFVKRNVLKTSFGLMVNSIFLSSSNNYNFFDMNKRQRREYIEDIFKISIFGDMLKLIRTNNNAALKLIALSEQKLNIAESNYNSYNTKHAEFESNKQNKIENERLSIETLLEKSSTFDTETSDATKFTDVIDAQKEKASFVDKAIVKLNTVNKVNKTKISHLSKEINKNKDILDKVCDDCKEKISSTYINDSSAHIEKLTTENKENAVKIKKLSTAAKSIKLNISKLSKKVKSISKANIVAEQNAILLESIDNNIANIEARIDDITSSQSPFSDLIEAEAKVCLSTKESLKVLYKQKTTFDILEHVVSEDGAKKYIINDLVSVLNTLILTYLERMGAEYTLNFDTSFDATFLTSSGECEYSSFSAGERQRINIATLFAFKDILETHGGLTSNLFIIDEILDIAIDKMAFLNILAILKEKQTENDTKTFIISHRIDESFDEHFNSVIRVTKENGHSTINKLEA